MAYTTINDPSVYFQNMLYTGDGSNSQNITNTGNSNLQPDLLWIKNRSTSSNPIIQDSSREIYRQFFTDNSSSEYNSGAWGHVNSVATDGFQVDVGNSSSEANANKNNDNYVAWQWKCNAGTQATESNDNINYTRQTNTTAGLTILKYSGATNASSDGDNNGGNYWKMDHGLGVTPNVGIFKKRSGSGAWYVYADVLGTVASGKHLQLQGTNAVQTETNLFGSSGSWSNTQVQIGGWDVVNRSGSTYVAYIFAEKQGFSKFGVYRGNNNADGPFVDTGFKPAWLLIKNYTASGNGWTMTDNARSPSNEATKYLLANTADTEATGVNIDLLSNGFKLRATAQNESQSYFYMAFAEHPFVSSAGVPTTAR